MPEDFNADHDPDRTVPNSVVPFAPQYSAPASSTPTPDPVAADSAASTNPSNKTVHVVIPPVPVYAPRAGIPPAPPPLSRESAARARARRRRVRGGSSSAEWVWVIIAAALLSVGLIMSLSIFLLLRSSQSELEVLPTSVVDLSALPTPANFRTDANTDPVTGQQIMLADGSSIILEPWDGQTRFTILVMGLDRRPGETGLAFRTDTMMLVSLDPRERTLGILSIPRDLYVPVPGYSELQRINSPLILGELYQPGSGAQLAMQTVQFNLGIRVHDYLIVDFDAFIDLVNAIDGIDVTIDYTINDRQYPDMFYGYDPFFLPAGTHRLDGYNALRFARTRHGDSDFERAQRQQATIFAIRDRILSLNMLPQLIIQAPTLLSSWRQNVYTGLSLDQIIRLAWFIKDIPLDNISTGVIDYRYTQNYMTSQGAAVLVPNRSALGPLMVQVFGANYSE